MFNRTLGSFVPTVYKDIVEMDDIISSEDAVMDIARTEMSAAFANTFVLTADESGVIMFERMLNIIANPQTEDLEFRRQRVLNRMSMNIPFTFRFLKQKLDEIIGVGAWTASIDFSSYTLYVQASAVNQNWYSELEFTINRMKPCNMVFINVPYTSASMSLTEEVSYRLPRWMYRLGNWRLGRNPFVTIRDGGVIKMPELKSIQPALLNGAANFVASDIAYVLINDTIEITEFMAKQVQDSVVSIEYAITSGVTKLVTNVKLMRSDGTVLTQADVYVPVTQTIFSKHTITVKEGA